MEKIEAVNLLNELRTTNEFLKNIYNEIAQIKAELIQERLRRDILETDGKPND